MKNEREEITTFRAQPSPALDHYGVPPGERRERRGNPPRIQGTDSLISLTFSLYRQRCQTAARCVLLTQFTSHFNSIHLNHLTSPLLQLPLPLLCSSLCFVSRTGAKESASLLFKEVEWVGEELTKVEASISQVRPYDHSGPRASFPPALSPSLPTCFPLFSP